MLLQRVANTNAFKAGNWLMLQQQLQSSWNIDYCCSGKLQSSWNATGNLIIIAETAANTLQSSWSTAKCLIVSACYRISNSADKLVEMYHHDWNECLIMCTAHELQSSQHRCQVHNRSSHSSTANDYWQQKFNELDTCIDFWLQRSRQVQMKSPLRTS